MKDHEIYADIPLETWRLDIEVEALRKFADAMGFDSFHVVGYSFGASLALAYASKYLDRLRSIALVEPDWIGNIGMSSEEVQQREELKNLQYVPPEKFLEEFMRLKVRSGVNITHLDVTSILEKRTVVYEPSCAASKQPNSSTESFGNLMDRSTLPSGT
jgi:pimeloyl-ACP methyl ester carboxylesterase